MLICCSQKYKQNDSSKKKWSKDEHTDIDNDSVASGAESSLSPSEAPEATQDMEDSSASESAQPKINPLKWTVSTLLFTLLNGPLFSTCSIKLYLSICQLII